MVINRNFTLSLALAILLCAIAIILIAQNSGEQGDSESSKSRFTGRSGGPGSASQEPFQDSSQSRNSGPRPSGRPAQFITTESGLQYEVLQEGFGSRPGPKDLVEVHYSGTLDDGTEFDSSHKRGSSAHFPLNNVIKGWQEGLQLMNAGSKFRFVIPPELAYGSSDIPGIPADSTLTFEVELISTSPIIK